jgi:hypothetical protein
MRVGQGQAGQPGSLGVQPGQLLPYCMHMQQTERVFEGDGPGFRVGQAAVQQIEQNGVGCVPSSGGGQTAAACRGIGSPRREPYALVRAIWGIT